MGSLPVLWKGNGLVPKTCWEVEVYRLFLKSIGASLLPPVELHANQELVIFILKPVYTC